jgi:hypothetical protein
MKFIFSYLGEKGLSSSKAAHLKNVAKEMADVYAIQLQNASLFTEVMLLKDENLSLDRQKPIDNLVEFCQNEGKIFGLSAWLGEGIKEKEAFLKQIKDAEVITLLEMEELPYPPELPKLELEPTELDVKAKWTIRERAELLSAEAMAASIGKKIHPHGKIAQWKTAIRTEKPVRFEPLSEKEVVVVKRTLLYEVEAIETIYFELQQAHRQANERVNYYKARLNNELNIAKATYQSKNAALLAEHKAAKNAWEKDIAILTKQAEGKRLEWMNKIANMKIVVPEDLKATLEYVENIAPSKDKKE